MVSKAREPTMTRLIGARSRQVLPDERPQPFPRLPGNEPPVRDDGPAESVGAAAGGPGLRRKRSDRLPDDGLGVVDVVPEVLHDELDADGLALVAPDVVIRDEVERRVADLGLAEKLGLRRPRH